MHVPSQLQGKNVEGAQGLQKYCTLSSLGNTLPHGPTSVLQHLHTYIFSGTWSIHTVTGGIVPTPAAVQNLGNLQQNMQSTICAYQPAPRTKSTSKKLMSISKWPAGTSPVPQKALTQVFYHLGPSHHTTDGAPAQARLLYPFTHSPLGGFSVSEPVAFFILHLGIGLIFFS